MTALLVLLFHLLGVLSSVHAVMTNRTAQGAIAWSVSLNTFPYLAVPLYWVFVSRQRASERVDREGWMEARPGTSAGAVSFAAEGSIHPGNDHGVG